MRPVVHHVQQFLPVWQYQNGSIFLWWLYFAVAMYIAMYIRVVLLVAQMDSDAKIFPLTRWGRVTHICVSNLTIIGSDDGLSPGRRQAIIWTSAGILLIGPLETNISDILIDIHTFSFMKMPLIISSGKSRPFSLGLNVLIVDRRTISPETSPFLEAVFLHWLIIYLTGHLGMKAGQPTNHTRPRQ